ncbi:MAG: hypothetical protein ACJ8CR_08325 [Roseiflexaceae bacterium]
MATTLLGIFDDPAASRHAINELHASGLELEDISIISRTGERARAVGDDEHLNAGEGATIGAVWGGLIGLAALLIPGVGPFIAGGAVFAALTGAVTGAVVGGITGALMDRASIPEEEARDYEMMVYSGKTLLAVKAHDQDADAVRRILAHAGARSIRDNQSDIAGGSRPVHVAGVEADSGDAEPELAPGGTIVRGASGMPAPTTPSSGGAAIVGVPGIYSVPEIHVDASGIYETSGLTETNAAVPTQREVDNIAAGTEDPYGTPQVDNQGQAILTEGWNRIGSVGDRQDTPPEPHNSDEDEASRRS